MKKWFLLTAAFMIYASCFSQKKPLDHTVYDAWQSIGERKISNNGQWFVYSINPQEGDNELVIQSSNAAYRQVIPRGYDAVITDDSRFVVFKIKPAYQQLREAKIKKKKPAEFPQDSLAIVELGKTGIWKKAMLKSFQVPEKGNNWVAFMVKSPEGIRIKSHTVDSARHQMVTDSLLHIIDSLRQQLTSVEKKPGKKGRDGFDADEGNGNEKDAEESGELVVRNMVNGKEVIFNHVLEYKFSKNGAKLVMETAADPKDSLSRRMVLRYDPTLNWTDTLSRGGNDFRDFALTDDGSRIAYVAERDAAPKALQKFYRIWYFEPGMDSAVLLADKNSVGMEVGMTVSEFGQLHFSKNGRRLFFGVAPVLPPKDTSLVDIDLVKLDIWHYKDDYLQTVQLKRLQQDLKKNYLAVYDLVSNRIHQLGSEELPQVIETGEGNGLTFIGVTDFGKRIESQWTGTTKKDIYAIDVNSGIKKLVVKNLDGLVYPSSTGKFILWYDRKLKNYFTWDGNAIKNISAKIKVPLYDEENDVPDDPYPYGVMGWLQDDSAVFVYDRYNIWQIDPTGKENPFLLTDGRKSKLVYRYLKLDPDEHFIPSGANLLLKTFNEINKNAGLAQWLSAAPHGNVKTIFIEAVAIGSVQRAKNFPALLITKESYTRSPDLYTNILPGTNLAAADPGSISLQCTQQLTRLNPQQQDYNWGTAELFTWKAYNGKNSTGIVYKPEDFNPRKKYPMICYFYEKLSDGLHQYIPPAPTPSRLNISFFVSRGYVVFAPDIHYGTGHPGRDAYNYIVSGARALVKKGFVDSTRIGIQGQSWGGYQVAFLVTATNLFKAAWAGAPVANMTSAYGGIRWGSGLNRQFQYERTQSRIGATLWEKPQLYLENSPLFHLQKVKTPLVIMSNDNDGAVPWYQGIELFTAMRRLGKKVWLLDYNGEDHNLVERKNRKDIQIREQQYFDWLLKDAKPAKWISQGVPAVKKGKDWGLELEE